MSSLLINVVHGIARRLKSRKVKDASVTPPTKKTKNKIMYGPLKPGSKVVPPSSKRKARPDSSTDDDDDDDAVKRSKSKKKVVLVEEADSNYDAEQDV